MLEPVVVHQDQTQRSQALSFLRRTQMLDRLSDILRRKGMPLLTNDAIHPHLKGVAVDSGKEKAHMPAGLLWVILFLAVMLPVRALSNDQTEPNAGKWRTWVI